MGLGSCFGGERCGLGGIGDGGRGGFGDGGYGFGGFGLGGGEGGLHMTQVFIHHCLLALTLQRPGLEHQEASFTSEQVMLGM